MGTRLLEPAVLAAAKDALYPDLEERAGTYAVTETQFTRSHWSDREIPGEIVDRLSPFNTIQLHSGEPDLLAVGRPATGVLAELPDARPVAAVEAKGESAAATNPVPAAIERAHAHLPEVNLGFAAAPADLIGDQSRALARELNVGLLAVDSPESATVLEPARAVGAGEFSPGVEAVRFRARTHRYAAGSFPLNHPKNYLGYPIAMVADGPTAGRYEASVIGDAELGRHGAILLGLLADRAGGDALTHRGAEVVRFARRREGSLDAALERFADWHGRSTRFTELAPDWARLARAVSMEYEPTRLLVRAMERRHAAGEPAPTIDRVAATACAIDRALGIEVCFAESRRDDVLTVDGTLDETALSDPGVYKSGLHFQFKAQLYHVGLVTERGTDEKGAVLEDRWALEDPVGEPLEGRS